MKMDSLGNRLWTVTYNGPESLVDMSRDLLLSRGNVYVAGFSVYKEMGENQGIALVKYDSLGNQQWANRYGAVGDTDADVGYANFDNTPNFHSISAGDSGDVYLTGYCLPYKMDAVGILLRYDPQGNLISVRQLSTTGERWFGATVFFGSAGVPYETGIHVRDDGHVEIFVAKFLGR